MLQKKFEIAGIILDIRGTSSELMHSLSSSFTHLPESINKANILVLAWSIDESKTNFPKPPFFPLSVGPLGDLRDYQSGRFRFVLYGNKGVLIATDCLDGIVIVVTQKKASLFGLESAAPLRTPLSLLLPSKGKVMVHAAAVSINGKAVLLVGRSGVGKSTLSSASHKADWKYLGDDLVALGREVIPKVFSLYSTAKLDSETQSSLPESTRISAWQEEGQKGVFRLDLLEPNPVELEAELRAVVLLDRTTEPGQYKRISQALVVSVIGASTQEVLLGERLELFKTLCSSLLGVPCWRFNPMIDLVKSYEILGSLVEQSEI